MSQRNSGYNRIGHEYYATPRWVIEALLQNQFFQSHIVEPCAGGGNMADVLREHDYMVTTYDIIGHSGIDHVVDFLSDECMPPPLVDFIVNPPYGTSGRLAVKFIEKCLKLTKPYEGSVAVLLRADFDSAKTRKHLFGEHPAFYRKFVLTDRISWANIEETGSPSTNHAWFVWDWSKFCLPTIKYLSKPKKEKKL